MFRTLLSIVAPTSIVGHLKNIGVGTVNKSKWISSFFIVDSFDPKNKKFILTDEQVEIYSKRFRILMLFYSVVTLLLIAYFVNLLILEKYAASLVAFSLFVFSIVNVFRYHFWLFHLTNKKICSLKEWWSGNVD